MIFDSIVSTCLVVYRNLENSFDFMRCQIILRKLLKIIQVYCLYVTCINIYLRIKNLCRFNVSEKKEVRATQCSFICCFSDSPSVCLLHLATLISSLPFELSKKHLLFKPSEFNVIFQCKVKYTIMFKVCNTTINIRASTEPCSDLPVSLKGKVSKRFAGPF